MEVTARRYARRIFFSHSALLICVLAIVALAGRQVYTHARDQVIKEAQDRQQLLTVQTATAIQNYYKSIQDDLDLIYRAEQEESTANSASPGAAEKPARSVQEKVVDYNVVTHPAIIRQVIWKQLEERVSLMFSYEHALFHRPDNRAGIIRPDIRASMRTVTIGNNDPSLNASDIVAQSHDWLSSLTGPSVSRFQIINGKGVNMIAIPMKTDVLVAVVPISGVQKQYLGDLNGNALLQTGAWLVNDNLIAMAASQPQFVGGKISTISDPDVRQLTESFILGHGSGTRVIPRSFKFDDTPFGPTMISAAPVTVANRTWELFIATPMAQVDGNVARLFDGAILWSIFVVVAVIGILASTAYQMIRSRLRQERDRHEALTKELAQARDIQLAWLPDSHPASLAINVAAINSPASHISGDFYNWFELPDGRLVVVIGDVTGHGMSAAFLMATTQLLVRNTMARLLDPGRCLEEVNRQLCVQAFSGQFVTMQIVILDLAAGQLHIATAGHPAPLVADGESFQPLPMEPQLLLGIDRDTQYITETFAMPPQSSILLYTDGVVECPDVKTDRFGDERLRRSLYGRYEDAQAMIDQVVTAVDAFRGKRELSDDLTVVAIQLQPTTVPSSTLAVVV